MKHVYKTYEIAHLWAHKIQDSARNSRGTFYFDGDTIYSYGGHFPIARHVEYKGRKAVLFTSERYSVTTAKHIHIVRAAIPHGTRVIYVSNQGGWYSRIDSRKLGRDEHIELVKQAAERGAASRRGRSRELKLAAYAQVAARANNYFEFYGYTRRYDLGVDGEGLAEIGRKAVERERRKNAKWIKEQFKKFRLGELGYLALIYGDFQLLRVVGDMVVTSLGAMVPLAHVQKALPLVLEYINQKRVYKPNGKSIHLGNFTIDGIDKKGVLTAGCHKVEAKEIRRLVKELEKVGDEEVVGDE